MNLVSPENIGIQRNESSDIITANEYYEATLANQRADVKEFIRDAIKSSDPVVRLPFDTYPAVEAEMEQLGWVYEGYKDANGNKCASFYPKQYLSDYVEEEDEKNKKKPKFEGVHNIFDNMSNC